MPDAPAAWQSSDAALAPTVWARMSPAQREVWRALVQSAPAPIDPDELAADLGLPGGRQAVASVLMSALRHFHSVDRELPVQVLQPSPHSRTLAVDEETAEAWRETVSGPPAR